MKNKFPIPIVEDLLDELGESEMFSKINLKSRAIEDIEKTAFKPF